MRAVVFGLMIGLGLLVGWSIGFPEAAAQRPAPSQDRAGSPELVTLSFDPGDGRQQITVIDPRSRAMAVYNVDRSTGAITLKSVRNLQFDLLIEDFNTANPSPREIRALTEQR